MLNDSDKRRLLTLARTTLEACLAQSTSPIIDAPNAALAEPLGAFVSLHRGENLRGCIGQIYPDRELYKIVKHCVLSAALDDPRFSPVTPEELPGLEIEISVLSPLKRIQKIEEIEVGRHGLYIVQGNYRGLLLPQVATQYRWNRTEFLEHTCNKSGIPKSAWRDPQTDIYVFEAEVFSDSDISDKPTQSR
jgi:AmmeMemoRadiSam system protein A